MKLTLLKDLPGLNLKSGQTFEVNDPEAAAAYIKNGTAENPETNKARSKK